MGLHVRGALLLWLSACATAAPQPLDQVVVPWVAPLVGPKPIALPMPVGLTPPLPVMVDPGAQPETKPEGTGSGRSPPAPPISERRRPECEPKPVPHRGGHALHNQCADQIPMNSFPGSDVLVNGKRFDALQLTTRTLWEVKTTAIETYNPFVQGRELQAQVEEAKLESDLAESCGYEFIVGVRTQAHKKMLESVAPYLKVVLMTWC